MSADKRNLSEEEKMAMLVDGIASPELLKALQSELLESNQNREEFFDLNEVANSNPAPLPSSLIDRYMAKMGHAFAREEKLVPLSSLHGIWFRLRDQVLELIDAPGWDNSRPAFRENESESDDHSEGLSLNQNWNTFNIGFNFIRIAPDAVNLTLTLKNPSLKKNPDIQVSLHRDGELIASRFLEDKQVLFREVKAGSYAIKISNQVGEIIKAEFKMEG